MRRSNAPSFQRLLLPLILLLALAACAPPEELNRPPSDASARAEDLLPPGGSREVTVDPARIAAGRWNTSRMRAERHGSPAEAAQAIAVLNGTLERRTGITTRSNGSFGDASYLRYSGAGLAGLAWSSGVWSFAAEAPDSTSLTALVRASRAGGIGETASSLLAWLPGLGAGVGLALAIGVFWLVRRLMRTGAVAPVPGVPVLAREALIARLRAVAPADAPFQMKDDGPDRFVFEWNFADARWADAFARRGLKETYRLRLRLDEAAHTVRARDETTSVSWDAGITGAPRIDYGATVTRGAALFQKKAAVGYALTPHGVEKAYDFAFDMMDMKGPVIAAVTQSGWRFEPALKL